MSGEKLSVVHHKRQKWMAVLAKALWTDLEAVWRDCDIPADYTVLRKPETGLVMLQARMGGSGAPFNFGEATVTRCTVKLLGGEVGHAYVMGSTFQHAEVAAVCDGLMQSEDSTSTTQQIIDPLIRLRTADAEIKSRKSAATKVDFFTMVRGEDAE